MAGELVATFVVLTLYVGFAFWILDRLLDRARQNGIPGGERLLIVAFAIIAGPLGILLAWWYAGRPRQATSVPA